MGEVPYPVSTLQHSSLLSHNTILRNRANGREQKKNLILIYIIFLKLIEKLNISFYFLLLSQFFSSLFSWVTHIDAKRKELRRKGRV